MVPAGPVKPDAPAGVAERRGKVTGPHFCANLNFRAKWSAHVWGADYRNRKARGRPSHQRIGVQS